VLLLWFISHVVVAIVGLFSSYWLQTLRLKKALALHSRDFFYVLVRLMVVDTCFCRFRRIELFVNG